jgi:hypothetical protein
MKQFFTTLCFALSCLAVNAQLNGNYTIDLSGTATATNYLSVNAAVSDLATGTRTDGGPVNGPGVSGPVTLRIVTGTGPYNEQITFPVITGASATNTIRLTGGPGREMIMFTGTTTADRQVIKLNGARHIILDSLTLVNNDASFGFGVHITNSADSNTVSNCNVIVNAASTSANFAGIVIGGTTVTTNGDHGDDNLIQNNSVTGGYYGISMRGSSTTIFNQRNRIIGNTIQDVYFYGVYCIYQNLPEISRNTISVRATATTSAYGIYLSTADRFIINRNRVISSGIYGIYLVTANYQNAASTSRASVTNNMIGGSFLSTTPYGIYATTNTTNVDFFHNSVSMTSGNGRCMYILGGSGNDVRNNSLAYFGSTTGYALYITQTTYVSSVDYNNFYAPGSSNFIYIGAAYTTATFIGGGGFNTNSRQGDPGYVNNVTNLHTSALQLYDAGTNVGVTTDYDGDTRPMLPTALYDIGADEFAPSVNDAGVTLLASPVQPFSSGNQNVNVAVTNFGAAMLTSATINWDVNSVLQTPYSWTGSLTTLSQSTPVTIGNYNFASGNAYNLRFWTTSPNGSADNNVLNDTLSMTVCVALSGVYTIGGVGADYATINDAVAALVCGGVSGPVTMNLTQGAGPFNEQVVIPPIPGTSSVNRVRFNGGANRETVQYAATLTNLRAVIELDGADYITLDSMTIRAIGTTYGYGVQLTNGADYNIVSHCDVHTSVTSTSTNFAGITISGATVTTNGDNGDWNIIQNNNVHGGYYGITMRGLSSTVYDQQNKIINNVVDSFYYYGIYSYQQDTAVISGNTITPRPTATTSSYSIYMGYTDRFVVASNDLKNPGTYGIYMTYGNYQNGTGTTRARVVNNMIGGGWRSTGTPYGIYVTTNSRNVDFWHNSVSLDNGNGRAIYILSGSGNDVRNNSFAVFGSATGYAAYISATTYVSGMDYNNYWAPGSANFIYIAGAYTPSTFIGAAGFNLNSLHGNPNYTNNATDLHANGAQLYDGGANLGITSDFDGDVRPLAPSSGYDIGADEYSPALNDALIISISGPSGVTCADSNMVISAVVYNNGITTITSLPITAIVSGNINTTVNTTYTTAIPAGGTDTVVVGTFNSHPGGTLTIEVYSSLVGDASNLNDTITTTVTVTPAATVATVTGDTVCVGFTGTLTATVDGFGHYWYDAPAGGNLIGSGDTVVTPVIAATTTFYVESMNSQASSITTTYDGGNGCMGAMFDIAPVANITIDSIAVNIGSTVAETVRIALIPVSYVGFETNSAAWTQVTVQNVVGQGAGNPTMVPIPSGLQLMAGQSYGIYVTLTATNLDYTTGSQIFSNGDMTITTGAGLCSPFGGVNPGRIFNGSLYYRVDRCPSLSRVPVTVTAVPAPVVALGPDNTVCGGQLLDAMNSGLNYLWSTGDNTQTIYADSTDSYFVAVSNAYCTVSDTINLIVNPNPVLTTTVADGNICLGETDTMTVSGAQLYVWTSGGNNSVEIVTPSTTTTYTVYAVGANGCGDSAMITINVNQLPNVGYNAASDSVCDGSSAILSGTGATSYTWTGGISDGVAFIPTATTTYTVTGVDSAGCSNAAVAVITVNPLPIVGFTQSATTVCPGNNVTFSGNGAASYSWSGGVTDGVPFVVSSTSTYTVTGTDANGCSDTAVATVTTFTLPNVGVNASATAVCAGDSVTLNGTGAQTYSWTSPVTDGVSFIPAATATYTVTGSDINGCSDTATVAVVVNALPTVTTTLNFSPICFDDANAALTGTPVGGSWSGNGVSGTTFDPSVAGNGTHQIIYTYTDANGCTNTASQPVQVDPCVGITEEVQQDMFALFPNPNSGTFTVQFFTNNDGALIEIVDATGKVVAVQNENFVTVGQSVLVTTENLATGLYSVRVTQGNETSVKRVSIVR